MQMDIKQLLPTTVRQGLLGANSPSALNPFATIADLTASITGTVNRAAMFTAPNIVGNASWEYIGTTYQPVTTGSYLGSPINNIGRFHTEGSFFFNGTPIAGITEWVFKYQLSANRFFSIEPDVHALALVDSGNFITQWNIVNTTAGTTSKTRVLLAGDLGATLQLVNNSSGITVGNIFNLAAAGNLIKSGGGPLVIGTVTSGDLIFATGTLQRATITTSGLMGIGTAVAVAPTSTLQVLNTGGGASHFRVGSSAVPLILDVSARNVGIGIAGSAAASLRVTIAGLSTTTGIRVDVSTAATGLLLEKISGSNGTTGLLSRVNSTFGTSANTMDVFQAALPGVQTALTLSVGAGSPQLYNGTGVSLNFAGNAGIIDTDYSRFQIGRITTQFVTNNTQSAMTFEVRVASVVVEAMRINQVAAVGIGTTTIVASALLQLDSTVKGFLPPRMTNAERTAIVAPAIGLIVYAIDVVEGLYINKFTGWTFIV